MDWAKVKTILIIIFLLLNIFLFVAILYNNSIFNFQSEYAQYATQYLRSKDIFVDTKISDVRGQYGIVIYGIKKYDVDFISEAVFGLVLTKKQEEHRVTAENEDKDKSIMLDDEYLYIKEKINNQNELLQSDKAFSDFLHSYLKKIGSRNQNLVLHLKNETSNEKTLIYVMKYKNSLLFDQRFIATINKQGDFSLSVPVREVKRVQSPTNETNEILSAYQILVMGKIPEGSSIIGVDFGYKQLSKDNIFDSPVWCVQLKDGQTLYYNALDGEIVN